MEVFKNKDRRERELYRGKGTNLIPPCFLKKINTKRTQRGTHTDLTGLPICLSIATHMHVEFQRNLANFLRKLLSCAVPDYKETNYNSFKRSNIIYRCISMVNCVLLSA